MDDSRPDISEFHTIAYIKVKPATESKSSKLVKNNRNVDKLEITDFKLLKHASLTNAKQDYDNITNIDMIRYVLYCDIKTFKSCYI